MPHWIYPLSAVPLTVPGRARRACVHHHTPSLLSPSLVGPYPPVPAGCGGIVNYDPNAPTGSAPRVQAFSRSGGDVVEPARLGPLALGRQVEDIARRLARAPIVHQHPAWAHLAIYGASPRPIACCPRRVPILEGLATRAFHAAEAPHGTSDWSRRGPEARSAASISSPNLAWSVRYSMPFAGAWPLKSASRPLHVGFGRVFFPNMFGFNNSKGIVGYGHQTT